MSGVVYRVLVPGQQHFDCEALRATLSTQACAARWQAAAPGTQCRRCSIGQAHRGQHHRQPDLPAMPRRAGEGACLRCGRTDLRLVSAKTLCVSCFNRAAEWRRGRNAKGTPVVRYRPPHSFPMAVRCSDGVIEHRRVEALHGVEAACLASRSLGEGETLVADADADAEARPGTSAWNAEAQRFESACRWCGATGLLERVGSGGVVRYHCRSCQEAPQGKGWQMARVQQQAMTMAPDELVAWLQACEPTAPEGHRWEPTAFVCSGCRASPLEARRLGGAWRVRCPSCNAGSDRSNSVYCAARVSALDCERPVAHPPLTDCSR